MSVSTSRSSVKRVEGATAGSATASGAVLLGAFLAATFGSPRGGRARNRAASALPEVLPVRNDVEIRESIGRLGHCGLTVETISSMSEHLAITVRPADVERVVDTLHRCQSPNERAGVISDLADIVSVSHKRVMSDAAVEACRVASAAVGFTDVHVIRAPESSIVRVVADDPAGHSIVSEIQCAVDGVRVDSEVVGVTDGSCVGIMSRFDRALEDAGLRSAQVKQRSTGGVCELAFSRALIRERWKNQMRPNVKGAPGSERRSGVGSRQAKVGGKR